MGWRISRIKIERTKCNTNRIIDFDEEYTIAKFADKLGVAVGTMQTRFNRVRKKEQPIAWLFKKDLIETTTVGDKTYNAKDIQEITGYSHVTSLKRLRLHRIGKMTGKRLLAPSEAKLREIEAKERLEQEAIVSEVTKRERNLYKEDIEGMKRRQRAKDKQYNEQIRKHYLGV